MKDVYDIPLNIRPLSIEHLGEKLRIEWPDGHESYYEYKFLWQNSLEGNDFHNKTIEPLLWTKSSIPAIDTMTVPLKTFRNSDEGKKILFLSILKYGIGFVSEVPINEQDTRKIIEEICPIKRTFFGEMWTFQDDLKHADTAYTNSYLGAHTDNTYFSEASRIQVLHCLKSAEVGGETLLVDGFNVANQFKKQNPNGYEFLATISTPSEYVGDGQYHKSHDVIFKHHPLTKKLYQFRYNIYDRAPIYTIPFSQMSEYYEHLNHLTSIIRLSRNEVWLKLQPGIVAFIDNWRVMHGRNSYSGHRIMTGCYLDNSEFMSKVRFLGINVG